jgi:3-methyladenine DNA glycosylase AlkC
MAALKDEIGVDLVRRLGAELAQAQPAFPRQRLQQGVAVELEPLELLARVDAIAGRLTRTLPARFDDAAAVLWAALASPSFTGWMTLPCGTYVARCGLDHPTIALPLLAGLTPRWSSEGPIRPFIEHHPDLTYTHLRRWATDDDEHVRRLVSEGTRPRLPWAPQLRGLISDPSPNLPLLESLVDDPSLYVRRSVANHLNDIAKDHPALAVDLARRWRSRGDGPAWVVRHGLRTLVKHGDPDALGLVGAHVDADVRLRSLAVDRESVPIGETVTIRFTLDLLGGPPADVVIDYGVHYMGVRGPKTPRVFKLTRRHLDVGDPMTLTRRHRFDHASIRRIHPGPHTIDVRVNGRVLGAVVVEVTDDSGASRRAQPAIERRPVAVEVEPGDPRRNS